MKKIKNIVVITGTYTNKDGQEKKRYQTIGSLFEDGENLKIKLDTIPLVDGGWTGWANCYELEDRAPSRAEKPKSGFDDLPDDLPF
jgi:hypothetical protein